MPPVQFGSSAWHIWGAGSLKSKCHYFQLESRQSGWFLWLLVCVFPQFFYLNLLWQSKLRPISPNAFRNNKEKITLSFDAVLPVLLINYRYIDVQYPYFTCYSLCFPKKGTNLSVESFGLMRQNFLWIESSFIVRSCRQSVILLPNIFKFCGLMGIFVSSSLLSKTLKIKIYKTMILPVVLYGRETWSLTLREERRLRVFENRVLRRVFGPKRDEVTGEWINNIRRSLGIFTPYPILCGW